MQQSHEQWSSRLGFILAAVGSAVGLANIWRFPYAAGSNGGGAFVFIYIAAILAVVLPILMAELLVGRRGQLSPPNAIAKVAKEAGASDNWRWMGLVGVVAAVLIFSFYSVVGGWTLSYVVKAASGELAGADAETIQASFDGLNANAFELFLWASSFLLLTVFVSARGVKAGIEKAVKVMMPLLFIMLVGLVIYSAVTADFAAAWRFLFTPDFSKVDSGVVLDAIGQAFFSIGVGITNLMAYGSYLDRQASIPRSSLTIIGADTLVALMAGLAIFPIIFAYNMDPSGGPGLVFMALPYAFGQMPGGGIIGALFFVLLFCAALTSAISMMECSVAWIREKFNLTRRRAAIISGAISWALGILSVLSFNLLADVHPLSMFSLFEGKTFFDIFDYVTSTLVMPLCSIFVAVFVGWVLPRSITVDELDGESVLYRSWRFLVRFVAPVGLAAVFVSLLAG
ncbi:sodium-dependent transporter [Pseudomaricurvus alkylphenolicus]|jgi:NSS family neurotransmitter:Na+ symporter|uniref:sodium-dependent transporter n=1 Tax=Pseudomaricurvus alkylphenolicus TaxID=1306991 RepID=UPI00141EE0C5|nr:sodium-dependent transporter [Pseudomaricurvus alkylphenolicus]NIB39168.1 sodium-dependent transporter [Pseudomaricurvus alkylphenolicus]